MKILSKFKQLKKDIKIVIITVLIMSCIGVYATGSCIVAATADDVTYNNTTVSAALNDLYGLTQNYCPPGYECNKRTMYNIMKKNAVLDNIASEYVTSSTGIDFSQISSDTNGKGVYEIASTKNDDYPIYYYRGAVDNNNVKFGGFCWKAIRTTDTGGVKLIYNGDPDGSGNCTNTTGTDTQISKSYYNNLYYSPAHVGYMKGTIYNVSPKKTPSELNVSYVYGNDVEYSNGTYTLKNTITTTGTWSSDYNTLNNNHYTCFSTGITCSEVYYIYYTNNSYGAFYMPLTDGKKTEDALNEMFSNSTNIVVKSDVDNWYNTNLSIYTNYIEDTIYCNDRSSIELNGWNPNGGDTTKNIYFNADTRVSTNKPSLTCSRVLDRFTVSSSNGNGALTYPIGLITSDEVMYAGGKYGANNSTYYLYNELNYWTISPSYFNGYYTRVYALNISSTGAIGEYLVSASLGVRPVISLKASDVVESGDGTQTNPYVIKTT